MRSHQRELLVPVAAERDPNSREMIRAWIANKGLHCALNVGTWREKETVGWGILLSDVARHIADALEKDQGQDKVQVLETIRTVFNDELDAPTAETSGDFV